mgnify:FL=1
MKLSTYNVIKKLNDDIWIYNTLTSGFIHTNIKEWKQIQCNIDTLPETFKNTLKENGIIVESNEVEVELYKYFYYNNAFANQVPFLYIAPTMKCNFGCFYCFENGNKNMGNMTNDIALKIVQFLKAQKKDKVNIVWFGGEPLLGFNQIQYISDLLYLYHIEFSSSLITNGSLLTLDKIKQLANLNVKFIQISMDGVGKIHDNRRCFLNGKPTFSLISSNITNLLLNSSIPVCIQITVDHSNETAYNDMQEYARENWSQYIESGQLRVGLNYVQNRTSFDNSGICFSKHDIIKNEIKKILSSNLSDVKIPQKALPCMFRSSWYYAIDPEGYLYKCIEHLGNPSKSVGSLCDDKLFLTKLATSCFNQDAFNDPKCTKCAVFPICGGGCPLDRIKNQNCNNDYCSKYKDGLSSLLPYLYKKIMQNQTNHEKI